MSRQPPSKPLIVVIGATGTGKSQLAVDIASRHNGEIINADAMQMYHGLPIITNKITVNPSETLGVPHHLISSVPLTAEPWRVTKFKDEALRLIREIRSRGRLPVVVGGTHYYVQGLLFEESLVEHEGDEEGEISREELDRRFPILLESTDKILEELRRVDPVMAERWHPNDRRKIQRSLEIWLTRGRRASEIYEEQRQQRAADAAEALVKESEGSHELSLKETLLFWVHAERETLNARLDARVDKMVAQGLIDEVRELAAFLECETSAGRPVDLTYGIWVSIGFKEFLPYLEALKQAADGPDIDAERVKQDGIEKMKAATRQYAKKQIKWIRFKLMTALNNAGVLNNLYLLDGSDISQFKATVSERALSVVGTFLEGNILPDPKSMSPMSQELLTSNQEDRRAKDWVKTTCDLCGMTAVSEQQWKVHLSSRGHRHQLRKRAKLIRAQEKNVVCG
jgi:tRNA dimethylallyltransferase